MRSQTKGVHAPVSLSPSGERGFNAKTGQGSMLAVMTEYPPKKERNVLLE